jgi:hypothetical protein
MGNMKSIRAEIEELKEQMAIVQKELLFPVRITVMLDDARQRVQRAAGLPVRGWRYGDRKPPGKVVQWIEANSHKTNSDKIIIRGEHVGMIWDAFEEHPRDVASRAAQQCSITLSGIAAAINAQPEGRSKEMLKDIFVYTYKLTVEQVQALHRAGEPLPRKLTTNRARQLAEKAEALLSSLTEEVGLKNSR